MLEIEAKIRVEDLAPFEKRLTELGAPFEGEFRQHDIFFDFPDRRLMNQDAGLRLRQMRRGDQEKYLLCYKGPRQGGPYKRRQEVEFAVEDGAAARELVRALGLENILEFAKNRRQWRLDECAVCLDHLPELGKFVEIEGPGEERIAGVLQKLHLESAPIEKQGYAHLMARQMGQK